MEQQVAALIRQATEMSERMRQNEQAAEQARQLPEAHRQPQQRKHLHLVGLDPARPKRQKHQGLMTGDSDLERFRRDINQRASAAKTLRGATGPGCFVPGLDGSNVDEYRSHPSPTRRRKHCD